MTKKDYELIAGVLKVYTTSMRSIDYKVTGIALVEEITIEMAHALRSTNPRFDFLKFTEASGIETK